jgi:hypothetical protein
MDSDKPSETEPVTTPRFMNGEFPDEINPDIYREIVEPLLSASMTDEQIARIDEYLKQVEEVIELLKSDKIGTTEAIKQLREISFVPPDGRTK